MAQLLAALGILALVVALYFMGTKGHKPEVVQAPSQSEEIQRAKQVEQIQLDAAEAQRQQIEQQTQANESKEDQINSQSGMAP